MTENDELFTPENVDEQIDSLSRNPDQRDGTASQQARVIEDLQHFYANMPANQARVIAQAWERIVEKHQTSPEKGRLHSMQRSQEEPQIRNNMPAARKKRTFVQQLSLLAAVVVTGILIASMVFVLNSARHDNAKHGTQVASGGTPQPKPPHPITGGACSIDTTTPHSQVSKTSVPGLYIFAQNEQSDNVLYRYDPQTKQQVVWSRKLCSAFQISGTVERNGILYVAGADWTHESGSGAVSYLYALNDTDGSAIWGVQFPTSVVPALPTNVTPNVSPHQGSSSVDLGAIEAPTVVNGIVYIVQRTGIVYAFSAATGGQLWTFNTGRNAWATTQDGNGSILDPSSIQVVNGVAYGSIVDRVFALNAVSGQKLWMHSFNDALDINQAPTIANGTIYFTTDVPGYGSVMHPDSYVYAFNAHTGAQQWVTGKMQGYLNGPVAFNGGVYVSSYDDAWYTLNPSSGAIEAQTTLAGSGYGGPVAINGVLYNLADTTLAVLNPDGSTKWSFSITGQYPTLDDVQKGVIYVSGRGSGVYAYSATDGSLLWHYDGYLPQPQGNSLVTIVP
ncbi:MAG TPA: PQQ-binding-like beta-propeller repeat protein [Ktedonobacteraceae bacterium]|jgi:outer membrane protein assembly factor BamB